MKRAMQQLYNEPRVHLEAYNPHRMRHNYDREEERFYNHTRREPDRGRTNSYRYNERECDIEQGHFHNYGLRNRQSQHDHDEMFGSYGESDRENHERRSYNLRMERSKANQDFAEEFDVKKNGMYYSHYARCGDRQWDRMPSFETGRRNSSVVRERRNYDDSRSRRHTALQESSGSSFSNHDFPRPRVYKRVNEESIMNEHTSFNRNNVSNDIELPFADKNRYRGLTERAQYGNNRWGKSYRNVKYFADNSQERNYSSSTFTDSRTECVSQANSKPINDCKSNESSLLEDKNKDLKNMVTAVDSNTVYGNEPKLKTNKQGQGILKSKTQVTKKCNTIANINKSGLHEMESKRESECVSEKDSHTNEQSRLEEESNNADFPNGCNNSAPKEQASIKREQDDATKSDFEVKEEDQQWSSPHQGKSSAEHCNQKPSRSSPTEKEQLEQNESRTCEDKPSTEERSQSSLQSPSAVKEQIQQNEFTAMCEVQSSNEHSNQNGLQSSSEMEHIEENKLTASEGKSSTEQCNQPESFTEKAQHQEKELITCEGKSSTEQCNKNSESPAREKEQFELNELTTCEVQSSSKQCKQNSESSCREKEQIEQFKQNSLESSSTEKAQLEQNDLTASEGKSSTEEFNKNFLELPSTEKKQLERNELTTCEGKSSTEKCYRNSESPSAEKEQLGQNESTTCEGKSSSEQCNQNSLQSTSTEKEQLEGKVLTHDGKTSTDDCKQNSLHLPSTKKEQLQQNGLSLEDKCSTEESNQSSLHSSSTEKEQLEQNELTCEGKASSEHRKQNSFKSSSIQKKQLEQHELTTCKGETSTDQCKSSTQNCNQNPSQSVSTEKEKLQESTAYEGKTSSELCKQYSPQSTLIKEDQLEQNEISAEDETPSKLNQHDLPQLQPQRIEDNPKTSEDQASNKTSLQILWQSAFKNVGQRKSSKQQNNKNLLLQSSPKKFEQKRQSESHSFIGLHSPEKQTELLRHKIDNGNENSKGSSSGNLSAEPVKTSSNSGAPLGQPSSPRHCKIFSGRQCLPPEYYVTFDQHYKKRELDTVVINRKIKDCEQNLDVTTSETSRQELNAVKGSTSPILQHTNGAISEELMGEVNFDISLHMGQNCKQNNEVLNTTKYHTLEENYTSGTRHLDNESLKNINSSCEEAGIGGVPSLLELCKKDLKRIYNQPEYSAKIPNKKRKSDGGDSFVNSDESRILSYNAGDSLPTRNESKKRKCEIDPSVKSVKSKKAFDSAEDNENKRRKYNGDISVKSSGSRAEQEYGSEKLPSHPDEIKLKESNGEDTFVKSTGSRKEQNSEGDGCLDNYENKGRKHNVGYSSVKCIGTGEQESGDEMLLKSSWHKKRKSECDAFAKPAGCKALNSVNDNVLAISNEIERKSIPGDTSVKSAKSKKTQGSVSDKLSSHSTEKKRRKTYGNDSSVTSPDRSKAWNSVNDRILENSNENKKRKGSGSHSPVKSSENREAQEIADDKLLESSLEKKTRKSTGSDLAVKFTKSREIQASTSNKLSDHSKRSEERKYDEGHSSVKTTERKKTLDSEDIILTNSNGQERRKSNGDTSKKSTENGEADHSATDEYVGDCGENKIRKSFGDDKSVKMKGRKSNGGTSNKSTESRKANHSSNDKHVGDCSGNERRKSDLSNKSVKKTGRKRQDSAVGKDLPNAIEGNVAIKPTESRDAQHSVKHKHSHSRKNERRKSEADDNSIKGTGIKRQDSAVDRILPNAIEGNVAIKPTECRDAQHSVADKHSGNSKQNERRKSDLNDNSVKATGKKMPGSANNSNGGENSKNVEVDIGIKSTESKETHHSKEQEGRKSHSGNYSTGKNTVDSSIGSENRKNIGGDTSVKFVEKGNKKRKRDGDDSSIKSTGKKKTQNSANTVLDVSDESERRKSIGSDGREAHNSGNSNLPGHSNENKIKSKGGDNGKKEALNLAIVMVNSCKSESDKGCESCASVKSKGSRETLHHGSNRPSVHDDSKQRKTDESNISAKFTVSRQANDNISANTNESKTLKSVGDDVSLKSTGSRNGIECVNDSKINGSKIKKHDKGSTVIKSNATKDSVAYTTENSFVNSKDIKIKKCSAPTGKLMQQEKADSCLSNSKHSKRRGSERRGTCMKSEGSAATQNSTDQLLVYPNKNERNKSYKKGSSINSAEIVHNTITDQIEGRNHNRGCTSVKFPENKKVQNPGDKEKVKEKQLCTNDSSTQEEKIAQVHSVLHADVEVHRKEDSSDVSLSATALDRTELGPQIEGKRKDDFKHSNINNTTEAQHFFLTLKEKMTSLFGDNEQREQNLIPIVSENSSSVVTNTVNTEADMVSLEQSLLENRSTPKLENVADLEVKQHASATVSSSDDFEPLSANDMSIACTSDKNGSKEQIMQKHINVETRVGERQVPAAAVAEEAFGINENNRNEKENTAVRNGTVIIETSHEPVIINLVDSEEEESQDNSELEIVKIVRLNKGNDANREETKAQQRNGDRTSKSHTDISSLVLGTKNEFGLDQHSDALKVHEVNREVVNNSNVTIANASNTVNDNAVANFYDIPNIGASSPISEPNNISCSRTFTPNISDIPNIDACTSSSEPNNISCSRAPTPNISDISNISVSTFTSVSEPNNITCSRTPTPNISAIPNLGASTSRTESSNISCGRALPSNINDIPNLGASTSASESSNISCSRALPSNINDIPNLGASTSASESSNISCSRALPSNINDIPNLGASTSISESSNISCGRALPSNINDIPNLGASTSASESSNISCSRALTPNALPAAEVAAPTVSANKAPMIRCVDIKSLRADIGFFADSDEKFDKATECIFIIVQAFGRYDERIVSASGLSEDRRSREVEQARNDFETSVGNVYEELLQLFSNLETTFNAVAKCILTRRLNAMTTPKVYSENDVEKCVTTARRVYQSRNISHNNTVRQERHHQSSNNENIIPSQNSQNRGLLQSAPNITSAINRNVDQVNITQHGSAQYSVSSGITGSNLPIIQTQRPEVVQNNAVQSGGAQQRELPNQRSGFQYPPMPVLQPIRSFNPAVPNVAAQNQLHYTRFSGPQVSHPVSYNVMPNTFPQNRGIPQGFSPALGIVPLTNAVANMHSTLANEGQQRHSAQMQQRYLQSWPIVQNAREMPAGQNARLQGYSQQNSTATSLSLRRLLQNNVQQNLQIATQQPPNSRINVNESGVTSLNTTVQPHHQRANDSTFHTVAANTLNSNTYQQNVQRAYGQRQFNNFANVNESGVRLNNTVSNPLTQLQYQRSDGSTVIPTANLQSQHLMGPPANSEWPVERQIRRTQSQVSRSFQNDNQPTNSGNCNRTMTSVVSTSQSSGGATNNVHPIQLDAGSNNANASITSNAFSANVGNVALNKKGRVKVTKRRNAITSQQNAEPVRSMDISNASYPRGVPSHILQQIPSLTPVPQSYRRAGFHPLINTQRLPDNVSGTAFTAPRTNVASAENNLQRPQVLPNNYNWNNSIQRESNSAMRVQATEATVVSSNSNFSYSHVQSINANTAIQKTNPGSSEAASGATALQRDITNSRRNSVSETHHRQSGSHSDNYSTPYVANNREVSSLSGSLNCQLCHSLKSTITTNSTTSSTVTTAEPSATITTVQDTSRNTVAANLINNVCEELSTYGKRPNSGQVLKTHASDTQEKSSDTNPLNKREESSVPAFHTSTMNQTSGLRNSRLQKNTDKNLAHNSADSVQKNSIKDGNGLHTTSKSSSKAKVCEFAATIADPATNCSSDAGESIQQEQAAVNAGIATSSTESARSTGVNPTSSTSTSASVVQNNEADKTSRTNPSSADDKVLSDSSKERHSASLGHPVDTPANGENGVDDSHAAQMEPEYELNELAVPRTLSRDSGYRTPSPEVAIQDDDEIEILCSTCGKEAKLMCGICKARLYCSIICQAKDWRNHYLHCAFHEDDEK